MRCTLSFSTVVTNWQYDLNSGIYYGRKIITISGAKGKKDRIVMLSEKLIPLLKKYLNKYQPSEFLFENPNGGKYSATSIRSFYKRSVLKAGIKKR